MKIFLKISGISFVHWITQILFSAVGSTLAEMDFKPAFIVDVFEILTKLLLLPIVLPILEIWPESLPGIVGHIPFLVNSFVWGSCIYFGLKKWIKSKSKRKNAMV